MKKLENFYEFAGAVVTAISNKEDVYIFNNADGYYFDEESNKSKDFYTDEMFDMRAFQKQLFRCYIEGEFPEYEEELHIVLDYVNDDESELFNIYDRLFIFWSN